MDFGLSDEQRLLESTLRGMLEERVPIERLRQLVEQDDPYDAGVWAGLAELGACGVLIPERFGGSGLGLLDAALVAQALGAHATPTPFLSCSVLAPVALLEAGSAEQQERWLPGLAGGSLRFGVAATELWSRREDAGVRCDGDVLSGKALMAIDVPGADAILVAPDDERLFVVAADAAGLRCERLLTIDATRNVAELVFENVRPEAALAHGAGARQALTRMLDAGRITLAADVLGACDTMLARAVEYAGQRSQFGRVIASFQAVKHMCAEMAASIEPARSLLWYAAHAFDELPDEASLVAAHALSLLSDIGRAVATASTEVHGGVGFTDEQNLHLWFKRIGLGRELLGGPTFLRERAAALHGW